MGAYGAVHKLSGVRDFQSAIGRLNLGQAVRVKPGPDDGGGVAVFTVAGECIGKLTARHAVAKALQSGEVVLHASINSVTAPGSKSPHFTPNVRIVTGGEGETFEMPPMAGPREYKLGLVGESNYPRAIELCEVGEAVALFEEPDNPHDPRAVAAIVQGKGTIGYVPRDSWATRLIVDERKLVLGTIASISGPHGKLGVVLDILINPFGSEAAASAKDGATLAAVSPLPIEPQSSAVPPRVDRKVVIWLAVIALLSIGFIIAGAY